MQHPVAFFASSGDREGNAGLGARVRGEVDVSVNARARRQGSTAQNWDTKPHLGHGCPQIRGVTRMPHVGSQRRMTRWSGLGRARIGVHYRPQIPPWLPCEAPRSRRLPAQHFSADGAHHLVDDGSGGSVRCRPSQTTSLPADLAA